MGESLTDLMKDIRRLFMLVYSDQCKTMADAIAKDVFIDALGTRNSTFVLWKENPNLSRRPP